MRSRQVLLASAGVVLALALGLFTAFATNASARAGPSVTAAGSQTYTDPAGDVTGAPDITAVVVTSDASTGMITVTVTAPGFTASTAPTTILKVYLNTDMNRLTGGTDQDGCDYYLAVGKDSTGSGWWISQWDSNRGTYGDAPESPTMSFAVSGDVFSWTMNKSDLGGTTGFPFFAWSSTWDANNQLIAEDFAPDGGDWVYMLSPPATTTPAPAPTTPKTPAAAPVVKPLIAAPVATPAQPVAGKRFTVSFAVTRSDSGMPLTSATMVSKPSVGGKAIVHTDSFRNGTARVTLMVPKTAKGKLLTVRVTIKSGGQTATKAATFHVR